MSHIDESDLEELIFGRLPAGPRRRLHNHLQQCEDCQCALDDVLDFVLSMKFELWSREWNQHHRPRRKLVSAPCDLMCDGH